MTHQHVAPRWLRFQQQATEVLIGTSGVETCIVRPTVVDDGAGGRAQTTEAVLSPVRRYFGAIVEDNAPSQSRLGDTTVQQYVLVGPPGDDIQDEDQFFVVGKSDVRYDIDWVDRNQDYQTKAYVKVVTS